MRVALLASVSHMAIMTTVYVNNTALDQWKRGR